MAQEIRPLFPLFFSTPDISLTVSPLKNRTLRFLCSILVALSVRRGLFPSRCGPRSAPSTRRSAGALQLPAPRPELPEAERHGERGEVSVGRRALRTARKNRGPWRQVDMPRL